MSVRIDDPQDLEPMDLAIEEKLPKGCATGTPRKDGADA